MFFIVVLVLAIVGLSSLLGGTVGAGALFVLPILAFKIVFFMALFGFIAQGMRGWHRPERRERPEWPSWTSRPRRSQRPERSSEERFDEWHRMAHARDEVDSWVEDLPEAE